MKPEKMKIEKRSSSPEMMREKKPEGVVGAYLTAWGTVDSYKTTFARGSFTKTFNERGNKIRAVWDHGELAGKVLEAYEDDYGPFVRVQFNLETEVGKKAFAHISAGDVDCFSFGFNVITDKWVEGIRTFTEVRVMEVSPVLYEANENAIITDARSENFGGNVLEGEIANLGHLLFNSLDRSLWEIKHNGKAIEEIIGKSDAAISEFHGAYLTYIKKAYEFSGNLDMLRSEPVTLKTEAIQLDDEVITRTSITKEELETLRKGNLLSQNKRFKLAELPEVIQELHQKQRNEAVETLCSELRAGGFSKAETSRFSALLFNEPADDFKFNGEKFLSEFRTMLIGG